MDPIYTTSDGVEIFTSPGSKSQSPFDFIVKFKEPGKRTRTPKHIHLIVEMYVKYAHNPELTLRLRHYFLEVYERITPVDCYPPELQIFNPSKVDPFVDLNSVGEFSVEFMMVVTELVMIQEKTNYPEGSLTQKLYSDFGVKDRFAVISSASLQKRFKPYI
jgi:hypothetical protein